MFWRMAGLSTTSPVESLLDKDGFTLEELLDEDDLIQECKSLNTRLINFLRGKTQILQLLKYIVEEPPEDSDNRRVFKFPFIACEIFTCEIDVILKTVVEDNELMGLLFSFLDPDRSHGALLAGYFSKVVICLLVRKTAVMMRYLQAHQEILKKLVDLIAITSIMEVLIRLVGADDNIHSFREESLHWLADTELLEMLVDKLSPPNSSEAHANAADTLSAVSRLSQSELTTKLSSPSFIARLFQNALEDQASKSTLVHSLSVCISLLDPKRYVLVGRGQHASDSLPPANPETINGMLQRLGDLLKLLDVQADGKILPTTYGELRPPLGIHRLKIIEFLSVLLRTNNEEARKELVQLGAIKSTIDLFFDYPFNNLLHHHVENIIISCVESNSKMLVDHLFADCDLVKRILHADRNPCVSNADNKPTVSATRKAPPRVGNMGHLTRISNRLLQAASLNADIQAYLQENIDWVEWKGDVLQKRNILENVCTWTCGRPNSLRDRPVDSDEDDFRERDYDIPTMASNLSREVFRYRMFESDDGDEALKPMDRDEDDVFFDDESAEVVISSLRLGEEHGREVNSASSANSSSSSSEDEVVNGGDEELVDTATSSDNGNGDVGSTTYTLPSGLEKLGILDNLSFFQDENTATQSFPERPTEWSGWQEPPPAEGTSGRMVISDNNPFKDDAEVPLAASSAVVVPSDDEERMGEAGTSLVSQDSEAMQNHDDEKGSGQVAEALFDENVQFVGVEVEGTAKAMEHALREGIVGEAGPILPTKSTVPVDNEVMTNADDVDFNDVNYWRSDYNSMAEVETL